MDRVGLLRWILGAAAALVLAGAACTEPAPPDMRSPSATSAELAASEPGPYTLGREPLTVTLRLPEERRERLASLAAGTSGSLRLFVEGIEMLHPGAVYEVHLEPSQGRTPGSTDPSFVGNVAIFGKAGEGRESTRSFDVTDRARALLGHGGPAAGPIRVTFVPSDRAEGSQAGAPEAFIRFRRVALVERPRS